MPLGKVLYSTAGWISAPRFSSDRQSIAFIEHPTTGDDGRVVLLGPDLKKRVLSRTYNSAQGLAWAPGDAEIWFTAAESGSARALYAVERANASVC